MIVENVHETDNFWTEGFEVTFPSVMEVSVSEGFFFTRLSDGEEMKHPYPNFSFEVQPDATLDVAYDVYLLEDGDLIQVDRTEMTEFNMPFYNGESKLRYTIMTFIVPPGTVNLESIQIRVNRAVNNFESQSE
jgi:hypothetical protein